MREVAVNRAEKQGTIREIQDLIEHNEAFYLVDFKGLRVKDISALRDRVRESSGHLRVVKNTLLKKAAAGTGLSGADEWMEGPTALAWAPIDPIPLAKALVAFAKENPKLKVKGGVVEGQAVDTAGVVSLSMLPGIDGVRAQLIGLLQAPATKLATLLQTPARNVSVCLSERGKQSEG
ncbi:MAG: 50S ribosomal protein L10 [Acidobacteria bacterium 37-65-4]|nr:MAG: 50S ribosomal protein L10 [Acidobacteria bacterium 37-65-4]